MSKVRAFHLRMGYHAPPIPPLVADPDLVRARSRMIREEYDELKAELEALTYADDPLRVVVLLQNILKEIVDLCYVAEGTAIALGLPFDAAYAEVHRSNMTKTPGKTPNSKAIKGPSYSEADMSRLVNIIESEEVEDESGR